MLWAHELNGYHRSGSRWRVIAICLGAVALIYGASLFTRDWRAPAPQQPGQPLAEQAAVRPIRGAARAVALETIPDVTGSVAAAAPRVEPEVTSALPRAAEPPASPPAAAKAAAVTEGAERSAETVPRTQAQAPAAKRTVRHAGVRMTRAASRRRVQHARLRAHARLRDARLRAQPAAWRQTAKVRGSRIATATPEASSPIAQLFQFLLPGTRN
jgi:hypothetical protein